MKKIINDSTIGRLCINVIYKKNTVHIEMDKEACKFLIAELTEFLNEPGTGFVDYDPDTGYDCGVLTKNSLGLMLSLRDH